MEGLIPCFTGQGTQHALSVDAVTALTSRLPDAVALSASHLSDVVGAEDFRSSTLRCTLLRLLLRILTPYGQLT